MYKTKQKLMKQYIHKEALKQQYVHYCINQF